jgi:hypothetical protein
VKLNVDLSSIPTRELRKETGADSLEYYSISYQLRIFFYSANMTFSLWYKKKCYGVVDAEYI